jgi:hypothetical protein
MNLSRALLLMLCVVGCSCTSLPNESKSRPPRFKNYGAVFRFIAQQAELPTDTATLFMLAADSSIEVLAFDEIPTLYLVTPHYFAGGLYDQIRGAQGNGRYYLLRPLNRDITAVGNLDRGFEVVGVADGNTYKWEWFNKRPRLVTAWHLSASESPTNIYDWNGSEFK